MKEGKGGERRPNYMVILGITLTSNSNTATNLAMHQSWFGIWASLPGINTGSKDPTSFV
jgi:hypothetical protein